MTRNHSTASPTQPLSPTRLWRGVAALMFSLLLAPAAAFADEPTTPATQPAAVAPAPADAAAPATPPVATPDATAPANAADGAAVPAEDAQQIVAEEGNSLGMAHDLSPWGMYKNADIIVKIVMIGLAIASIITWTIWIAKGFEVLGAKRRLRTEIANLKKARTLKEASESAAKEGTLAHLLVQDALEEMRLSANSREKEGIKERVSFRLERLVAACGRNMSSGTGVLATIGSTAPFVGLFGTVWGIMRSFTAIAAENNSSLAVVAPGIAEALFATAIGLFAAIPAVIAYNAFSQRLNRLESRLGRFADGLHATFSRELEVDA